MEPRLQKQLSALESMVRRTRRFRRMTFCWAAAAVFGLILLLVRKLTGWNPPLLWMFPLIAGLLGAIILWKRETRRASDFNLLVAALEHEHPELRHLLSTAVEQKPDAATGEFGFLQTRVIDEILTHRRKVLWKQDLEIKLFSAKNKHAVALVAFLAVIYFSHNSRRWGTESAPWLAREITVTPGDVELERGTGLLISARFGGKPPPEATLVFLPASGKTKRWPMERHLADPVFGASLIEVAEPGIYHVEYLGKRTGDYKIRVFDFPALQRADAHLQFPAYTSLTNKTIPDTRRVSAVEGTRLNYIFQLNKPVARARLVGPERTLVLSLRSNAVAALNDFTITNSARYRLELVDAEGRTNKTPVEFTVQALTNRLPDLKLVFPRGDQRVSRLEEIHLQAEATDDFGLVKYGIGFGLAGNEATIEESGQAAPANEKRQFSLMIDLEKFGAQVDNLISYFVWADDYGPDGQIRRTYSDMFFAEVRPFEEIFRRDPSGGEGEGGEQSQQGNQTTKLAELQKQIVIATWKLQRETKPPN
ncbi:MAG: hypothetical protein ABIQ35_07540 [Verrucomicrobiota bacterium]